MISKSTTDALQSPTFPESSENNNRSVLNDDVLIEGDLTSDGFVEFGGKIIGNITADTLLVTPEGRVNGNVSARNVSIEGQLKGTITAINILVKSDSNVMADINAEQILIEAGAEIQGNI